MSQLSKQEIFDTAARFLVKQGCRAMHEESCTYRDAEGRRCAVGALLTDEEIAAIQSNGAMGSNAATLFSSDLLPARLATSPMRDLQFVSDLQSAHDMSPDDGFMDEWPDTMRALATEHNLSTAALDEALAERSKS